MDDEDYFHIVIVGKIEIPYAPNGKAPELHRHIFT
jgi:hypothetical protein